MEEVGLEKTPVNELSEVNTETQHDSGPHETTHPMKWHNFLMIAMVICAILTFCDGLNTLTGWNFGDANLKASRIDNLFPELKSCETFYGIALVVLGVYEFIVRNRLKNYWRNALGLLMFKYVFGIIIFLVYTIWASFAINGTVFDISGAVLSGLCVIFLIVNGIYYSKRKDLFVN